MLWVPPLGLHLLRWYERIKHGFAVVLRQAIKGLLSEITCVCIRIICFLEFSVLSFSQSGLSLVK